MNEQPDLAPVLSAFFAGGTDVLPDRVIDAALQEVQETGQRRATRFPGPGRSVLRSPVWYALPVLVLALVAGGVFYANQTSSPGVAPVLPSASEPSVSATPSPRPTPVQLVTECADDLPRSTCVGAQEAALEAVRGSGRTPTKLWVTHGVICGGEQFLFDVLQPACPLPQPPAGGTWVANVEIAFADTDEHAGVNVAQVGSGFVAEVIGYRVPSPNWCPGDCPEADRPYALDCGPLAELRCRQLADRIVQANAEGHPGRKVISIMVSTECGSNTVLYDDGTGTGADVDCLRSSPPTPAGPPIDTTLEPVSRSQPSTDAKEALRVCVRPEHMDLVSGMALLDSARDVPLYGWWFGDPPELMTDAQAWVVQYDGDVPMRRWVAHDPTCVVIGGIRTWFLTGGYSSLDGREEPRSELAVPPVLALPPLEP